MTDNNTQIFSDLSLARRLERTEARSNASFVEARARAFPEIGAEWIEVCGVYAMFDGSESPLTQTFGLGLFDSVSANDLDRIERFFQERGAPVFHEVSPLADPAILPLLNERGYQPCEFTTVLYRSIERGATFTELRNEKIQVRLTTASEVDLWAQTSSRGWSEFPELAEFMLMFGKVVAQRRDGLSFIAELDGKPIATGAMSIYDDVALLAGASTIPEGRKQGAQLALLDSRLRYAADHGCTIATMGALPGSASQRNAERQGFRIAYTRTKWQLTG
ncbi:MAG TPA: GNAT family N-acetyltransferase [Pyrinomonadaceae bacterium]|nr:GNAT family N-acetyltransferase [Pyrinomonadaceae bacterium]